MRAVLIVMLLLAWLACLLGAVGCTGYLVARIVRRLPGRAGRGGPPAVRQEAVTPLVVFAVLMAAAAGGLAGTVRWWGNVPGPWSSALAWAALPLWAAVAAATAAVVVRHDR